MARAAQAGLAVQVVVFAFDPDPATTAGRALHLLTVGRALPEAAVERDERFSEAALRAVREAGVELEAGRRRARESRSPLQLVGLDDDPASRSRAVTAWYQGVAPFVAPGAGGAWVPAGGRASRVDARGAGALKAALERLRQDTRTVSGAAALLGDVFTGDDLLRLHVALHGGLQGSERTFRRRVQELRDADVLRPVRDTEVAALRLRTPRFRSPAGTGGRPPELLRYAGGGGDEEPLAGLRARRSA